MSYLSLNCLVRRRGLSRIILILDILYPGALYGKLVLSQLRAEWSLMLQVKPLAENL